MAEIKVGKYITIVDEDDYKKFKDLKFHPFINRKNGYIYPRLTSNEKREYLHRMILGITDSKIQIDHINMNTLDNRKCNLRVCERGAQNAINRPKQKNNTTGYKGVFQRKETHYKIPKYRAAIRVEQKLIHLGHFDNPKDAAKAYNEAAKKYFGEFAYLNKIEE